MLVAASTLDAIEGYTLVVLLVLWASCRSGLPRRSTFRSASTACSAGSAPHARGMRYSARGRRWSTTGGSPAHHGEMA